MPEQTSPDSQDGKDKQKVASPPYEGALNAALEKLTDQVLIFLLAYVILVIGVYVFASQVANELRMLLYLIPILGVAAYVWTRRRGLSRQAHVGDVQVRSAIATGENTYVGGERGPVKEGLGATKVGSLIATGGATVVGRDIGGAAGKQETSSTGSDYLLQVFKSLNERNQRSVVSKAQSLLDQQQTSNG